MSTTVLTCDRIRNGRQGNDWIGYDYRDTGEGLAELAILTGLRPALELFREVSNFRVEEIPTGNGFDGRGFLLHRSAAAIATEGSDADKYYGTFISRNGQDDHCSCRGCQAHGHCKHLTVLRQLVEGGHIDDPRHDPRPEPLPPANEVATAWTLEAPF